MVSAERLEMLHGLQYAAGNFFSGLEDAVHVVYGAQESRFRFAYGYTFVTRFAKGIVVIGVDGNKHPVFGEADGFVKLLERGSLIEATGPDIAVFSSVH